MTTTQLVLFVMPVISLFVGFGAGFLIRNQYITLLALPLTVVLMHAVVVFPIMQFSYAVWLITALMFSGMIMVPAALAGEDIRRRFDRYRTRDVTYPSEKQVIK
ncbi:hypothetical protein [Alkalicoccus luteus]|uniref:Uncharacterized protein n=1 Tax=Alkalicoccus luteus TaxID=1237094 RepID=A0A969PUM3_9BACI|nr:hypothetical protein [Alkalicoccus luteus]NJP37819.1 hypothetical protein [Alkalicoccus luteus]